MNSPFVRCLLLVLAGVLLSVPICRADPRPPGPWSDWQVNMPGVDTRYRFGADDPDIAAKTPYVEWEIKNVDTKTLKMHFVIYSISPQEDGRSGKGTIAPGKALLWGSRFKTPSGHTELIITKDN